MKKQVLLLSVIVVGVCGNKSVAQMNQVAANTSSYNAVKADVPAGSSYNNNSSSNYNNYQANTLQRVETSPTRNTYDAAVHNPAAVVRTYYSAPDSKPETYGKATGTSYPNNQYNSSGIWASMAPIRGNAASGPYGSGSYGAPPGSRYNHVTRYCYPSYCSYYTKEKCDTRNCDSVRINCPPLADDIFMFLYGWRMYGRFAFLAPVYNYYLFNEDISMPDRTVHYSSYNGYIVYGIDTMRGVITMDRSSVHLEQPINDKKELAATTAYSNKQLKAIVLFKGNRILHLTRFSEKERELWRIVHTGKLNIYDPIFSFPTPNNIGRSMLKIAYHGQGTYKEVRNKKQLTDHINAAYGLKLDAKKYTWQELFALIDKLD